MNQSDKQPSEPKQPAPTTERAVERNAPENVAAAEEIQKRLLEAYRRRRGI